MLLESGDVSIDDREADREKFLKYLTSQAVGAKINRLDSGDFAWRVRDTVSGWELPVVVERKTVQDLVNSISDGRLGKFLDGEKENTLRILLVEGRAHGIIRGGFGWTTEAIENALLECQMRGVYVTHCQERKVAQRVKALWEWTLKPHHRTLTKPALPDISNGYEDDSEKRAVRFLMGLPGWGEVRARESFRVLGGLSQVLSAIYERDYSAFAPVAGVGKGTVDSAADFLNQ